MLWQKERCVHGRLRLIAEADSRLQKGPSVPEMVVVLGLDETLSRLRRGGEFVKAQDLARRKAAIAE